MSWLSQGLKAVGGWVAGDGNRPGSPETRELGYESAEVADAVTYVLAQPSTPNVQRELVVMAVVGAGLIFLLRKE